MDSCADFIRIEWINAILNGFLRMAMTSDFGRLVGTTNGARWTDRRKGDAGQSVSGKGRKSIASPLDRPSEIIQKHGRDRLTSRTFSATILHN